MFTCPTCEKKTDHLNFERTLAETGTCEPERSGDMAEVNQYAEVEGKETMFSLHVIESFQKEIFFTYPCCGEVAATVINS